MIPISRIYEPLCEIPEQSVVVLESGEKVHFIRTDPNEFIKGALPECRVRSLESGEQRHIHHATPARYVSSIVDYSSLAEIA